MLKKALAGSFAVATVFAVAGCPMLNNLIPAIPVELPEQSTTLGDIWSGSKTLNGTEAVVPAIPESGTYVKIPPGDDGIKVDVPADAKDKTDKIDTATLEFSATNGSSLPIKFQVFLAKEKPFASTSLGTVEFAATGTSTGSVKLDTTLLKEATLRLGMGVSSPGSSGAKIKIDSDGKITVKPKLVVKVKLF